jgi:catechol 2,3-dioxygenase-like lactoylglutathione lyase family enzyme
MIGYVMLGTNDLARARKFYDAVVGPLGGAVLDAWSNDTHIFWGAGAGKPMFGVTKPYDGGAAGPGNGTMISFAAGTRAQVDAAHATALKLGGKDEGAPGIRGSDPNGFYAAYFRDLDGNKLCAFRVGPP